MHVVQLSREFSSGCFENLIPVQRRRGVSARTNICRVHRHVDLKDPGFHQNQYFSLGSAAKAVSAPLSNENHACGLPLY